jgi:hypothetical protein
VIKKRRIVPLLCNVNLNFSFRDRDEGLVQFYAVSIIQEF